MEFFVMRLRIVNGGENKRQDAVWKRVLENEGNYALRFFVRIEG